MKKILALTSAIVSMFAVEASATLAKNGWDATDEARFDNNLRAFRSAIGVGAGDTIDTASALSAMTTRATALLGDSTNANLQTRFTALTRAYNTADATGAGLTADLVDASDAITHIVGTRAQYNNFVIAMNAGNYFEVGQNGLPNAAGSLFGAGVTAAQPSQNLSLPAGLATPTAAYPWAANPGPAVNAGDVDDNSFARLSAYNALMYRRLFRAEDATIDASNVAARRAQALVVATALAGAAVATLPTEDQWTLSHNALFFMTAQLVNAYR